MAVHFGGSVHPEMCHSPTPESGRLSAAKSQAVSLSLVCALALVDAQVLYPRIVLLPTSYIYYMLRSACCVPASTKPLVLPIAFFPIIC